MRRAAERAPLGPAGEPRRQQVGRAGARGSAAARHPGLSAPRAKPAQAVSQRFGFSTKIVWNVASSITPCSRSDGTTGFLPLNEAKKFQVYGREEITFAKDDKLRITLNGFVPETRPGAGQGKKRLDNGELCDIDGFTRGGDIRLKNGVVIPKNYGGLTHGYVVTSHASQGKTVDTVLVALGSESLAAANRQQFYVSVSRWREAVRLYTDDKAGVLDAVQRSAARLSATELMGSEEARPKRKRGAISQAFRLHEIQRAYETLRGHMNAWGFIRHQKEDRHVGR